MTCLHFLILRKPGSSTGGGDGTGGGRDIGGGKRYWNLTWAIRVAKKKLNLGDSLPLLCFPVRESKGIQGVY